MGYGKKEILVRGTNLQFYYSIGYLEKYHLEEHTAKKYFKHAHSETKHGKHDHNVGKNGKHANCAEK